MKTNELKTALLVSVILALTILTSCRNRATSGTGVEPIIISSPIANLEKIFVSSPGEATSETDPVVRVTGLDESVSAASTVTITNAANGVSESTTASSTGAFQLEIIAGTGDTLSLAVSIDGETEDQSYTVSSASPFPLAESYTDVSFDGDTGYAYLTFAAGSSHSVTVLDTNTDTTRATLDLTDAGTGTAIANIEDIAVFSEIDRAMIVDESLLNIYLVDLTSLAIEGDAIGLSGNFATIIAANQVNMHFTGATSAAGLRSALVGFATIVNEAFSTIPDAGTDLFIDANISSTQIDIVFAGEINGALTVSQFIVDATTYEVLSRESLSLGTGEPGGLVVNSTRSFAYIANQTDQSGLGDNHSIKSVSLGGTLALDQAAFVAGVPVDLAISADDALLYTIQNNTHQLLTLNAATLATVASTDTGPNPTGLSLAASGDTVIVFNDGDDTLSTIAVGE